MLNQPLCKLENRFRGRVTRLGSSGADIHTLPKAQLPFPAPRVSNSGDTNILSGCDNIPGIYPIASIHDHGTTKCLQILTVTYLLGKGGLRLP